MSYFRIKPLPTVGFLYIRSLGTPAFKRQLSLECRLELVMLLMNRIKQNL